MIKPQNGGERKGKEGRGGLLSSSCGREIRVKVDEALKEMEQVRREGGSTSSSWDQGFSRPIEIVRVPSFYPLLHTAWW